MVSCMCVCGSVVTATICLTENFSFILSTVSCLIVLFLKLPSSMTVASIFFPNYFEFVLEYQKVI